ncbi:MULTISPECIES: helix-turn-helix domain-containing protein [Rhizobium/Agrobacterium group]|uniref:DNA-binding HxlR family transcriptional regulator n=1 Tax=Rhizobium soli TaxID=424798 RepID=A0A7X0JQ95_9HYPH|nr:MULTISPECIES: helix-turn-helix domain-containing protein [Rhizobium/Agrobacterium group]MBB6510892.1 DNA-binding HxlR family transcriptional regulator [Rhizobium soli]NSY20054.1 helix-turn-helix transcriptional regulator [Neorhizobium sp. AL 9.2.2]
MSDTHIDVRPAAVLIPCGAPGDEDCGLRLILDRLGEQWTVMALAELTPGPRRYRQLERALSGISQRMMTLTLRRLERDGHVVRHVEASVPPSVTYELTQLGRSFASQVAALVEWSRDSKHQIELAQESFDARQGA